MTLIDLHNHTRASDGRWTASELLTNVKSEGIDIFSITDHDTIVGSEEMKTIITEDDPLFIPGVEVACTYKGKEIHLTTYHYNIEDREFMDLLNRNRSYRDKYDRQVIVELSKIYEGLSLEDYIDYYFDRSKGGWKGLNYLIDNGLCENIYDFFEKTKDFEFKMTFEHPKDVIRIILESGAMPFLAHPAAYRRGDRLSYDELSEWVEFGVMGIECFTPYNGHGDEEYYKTFCLKNNIMVSGGSDCHGGFVGRKLGVPKVTFEDCSIEQLIHII